MQNVTVQNVTVQDVTVNVFPGGFNWGIYVAQHNGLFARNGLRVTMQETPNSVAQMTALSAGTCDIAMTAVDNIVAYVEGQGEAPMAHNRNSSHSWAAIPDS